MFNLNFSKNDKRILGISGFLIISVFSALGGVISHENDGKITTGVASGGLLGIIVYAAIFFSYALSSCSCCSLDDCLESSGDSANEVGTDEVLHEAEECQAVVRKCLDATIDNENALSRYQQKYETVQEELGITKEDLDRNDAFIQGAKNYVAANDQELEELGRIIRQLVNPRGGFFSGARSVPQIEAPQETPMLEMNRDH